VPTAQAGDLIAALNAAGAPAAAAIGEVRDEPVGLLVE